MEKLDVAIVEATAITEKGHIIPGASVGATPEIVQSASKIIIEVNTELPIIAVIESKEPDHTTDCESQDDTSRHIANHILDLFEHEVEMGRMPAQLLPLQSGVGNIANAIIGGLADGPFSDVEVWTEVIQATSVAFSPAGFKRFYEMWGELKDRLVLRSQSVSNSPEIIRRLGVIAMNTPIEFDIYGHANSTHVCGTKMLNGLGGSNDFLRNAKLSIVHTPSTRPTKKDPIDILVTEQGLADVRGLAPIERARVIIDKCAHPKYRPILNDYLNLAEKKCLKIGAAHEPHLLDKVFKMHLNVLSENNTMRIDSW
ncbi:6402_t:CDS:2 [Racocetra fulgida]|uniref:6402_t:CDS:1 n=1 Tax=Racocetra fulgida TaxID=60492 RepID=A0A9N8ZHT8_9GLOM|nr:6402_t:CDS:2 [Racocetra fulgida]